MAETTTDALKLAAELRTSTFSGYKALADAADMLEQQHAALESLREEVESLRAGRVPDGWRFIRTHDGIDVISPRGDKVYVEQIATTDRRLPEEVLHLLADSLLSAAPTPPQAEQAQPDDAMDAKRGRWLLNWLKQVGLLQCEFGQMGAGEKPSNWWLLYPPYGANKTVPFAGCGKSDAEAIDAAMSAQEQAKRLDDAGTYTGTNDQKQALIG